YQTFPGPFATQHGALVGNGGVGPTMGKTSRSRLTIAKLSGLWAGVKPSLSPQNAAPSGVLLAVSGSGTGTTEPLGAPQGVSGSWSTEPDLRVMAAQVLPTAIWPAEESASLMTPPGPPKGH